MARRKHADTARAKADAARTAEIASLRDEARKLLGRQPEARAQARRALADVREVDAARRAVTSQVLADRMRAVVDEAMSRYFASRHGVRNVDTLGDAVAHIGAAGAWTIDDVARALLDRPVATADELREGRGDAARKKAGRARRAHRNAIRKGRDAIESALEALANPSAATAHFDALSLGWQLRSLWGAAYLGRGDGYLRDPRAEHSALFASRIADLATTLPASGAAHVRRMLAFVVAVAIMHVGPSPDVTQRVFAALPDVPTDVLDEHADMIAEIVVVVTRGDGATYATAIDALIAQGTKTQRSEAQDRPV